LVRHGAKIHCSPASTEPTKLLEDSATLQHLMFEAQAEVMRLQTLIAGFVLSVAVAPPSTQNR
jgi:hypothetical protein